MTLPIADDVVPPRPALPTSGNQFTPKLVTMVREGYRLQYFKADAMAGLTVAIVALPLSMALAIASGVTPDRGLYAAIVGGFIVSALGGSRFQIGGPAGAFIVLVAACVERHGVDGMLLATVMAGLMLTVIGVMRLGTYIKYIPYPVTIGFTAGIAVIIVASQIHDLLGLTLQGKEPGNLLPKLQALGSAIGTISLAAVAIAALTFSIILGVKKLRPMWPGMLIAIVVASLLAFFLNLPLETVGTRFGDIPRTLPMPALPALSLEKFYAVLPDALAFALLGAIESLLSAVVADNMAGRQHRSNIELVAQGLANVGSGAHGPISGMLHSVFLLLFMLLAAPLARYIPLAALAALLAGVAWNMAEKHEIAALLRGNWSGLLMLMATFLLTIFYGLTEGILAGCSVGVISWALARRATVGDGERQRPQ